MSEIKTIPIPFNEVSEVFLNPERVHTLDLANSKLKGESFITYISNMKLKCILIKDSNIDIEEKLDVLYNFLTYPYLVDCSTLVDCSLAVFLKYRDISFDNSKYWLSPEEMDLFIKNYPELINNLASFYDSLIIGIPSFNTIFKKDFLEPAIENGDIELVEDPNLISVNAISLLKIPNFLEYFIAAKKDHFDKMKYYKYQIEKFSYDKKSLFDIIVDLKDNSFLLSLINIFFSDEKEEKEILDKNLKILGVL